MHKHTLRELSKFASGLVAADLLCWLWLYSSGLLPRTFLGIYIDYQRSVLGMIFDIILLAILIHLGWNTKDKPRTKGEHRFHIAAGVIFTIVALLHLSRILFGWQLVIGSWHVPYWINGLGVVITAFLAYASFGLAN